MVAASFFFCPDGTPRGHLSARFHAAIAYPDDETSCEQLTLLLSDGYRRWESNGGWLEQSALISHIEAQILANGLQKNAAAGLITLVFYQASRASIPDLTLYKAAGIVKTLIERCKLDTDRPLTAVKRISQDEQETVRYRITSSREDLTKRFKRHRAASSLSAASFLLPSETPQGTPKESDQAALCILRAAAEIEKTVAHTFPKYFPETLRLADALEKRYPPFRPRWLISPRSDHFTSEIIRDLKNL